MTQCKKSELDKAGTRLTHADFVNRGFMVKLLEMPTTAKNSWMKPP